MGVFEAAKAIEGQIVGWRRQIHMYPEIGMETVRTAALVADTLRSFGIEVRENVAGYGVVGLLSGESSEGTGAPATVALRADMDALPIKEETGKEYASQIPGVMHACGHDAHTAMLLGAAKILSDAKGQFRGNVKFIFQPGEEGPGGAKPMIEDGCLENPRPDIIFGGHVGPLWMVKSGEIGVRSGPLMAASDQITIGVHGVGGHGAAPHLSVDPIVLASHIVLALQTIVSRQVDPNVPAVVTIGKIHAGTAGNIIPEICNMVGTVRYLDPALKQFMPAQIKEIATTVARGLGGSASVEYRYGYPPLVNDEAATSFLADSAASIIGRENVKQIQPSMGAEDMAYYLNEIPGTFFAIGSANPEKGTTYPNHHPKFDVDEDVLPLGSAVFAKATLDYLNRKA